MILQSEIVDQCINETTRGRFVKDVIATREGSHPIAIVRKRLASESSTKAAVLLVHGFGQNRYAWHCSRRSFSSFLASQGYDVFNLDLRGRGRSRRFGALHDSGIDDYIRDDLPAAVHAVLRISGHTQVCLIGHSMGGLISYGTSGSSMREYVSGVITLGSPYRLGKGVPFISLAGPLLYATRFTGIFDGNPPIPFRMLGAHMRKRMRLWDSRFFHAPLRPWYPGSMEPEVLEENLATAFEHTRMGIALGLLSIGAENALKSHDGMTDYGLAFELSDKPLLVIAGTHDALAAPDSVRPAYERSRSSDKTYREFPMGHIDLILGRDAPFTVWPLIKTWLNARAEQLSCASLRSSVLPPA